MNDYLIRKNKAKRQVMLSLDDMYEKFCLEGYFDEVMVEAVFFDIVDTLDCDDDVKEDLIENWALDAKDIYALKTS